jgi:hypothetical protein
MEIYCISRYIVYQDCYIVYQDCYILDCYTRLFVIYTELLVNNLLPPSSRCNGVGCSLFAQNVGTSPHRYATYHPSVPQCRYFYIRTLIFVQ